MSRLRPWVAMFLTAMLVLLALPGCQKPQASEPLPRESQTSPRPSPPWYPISSFYLSEPVVEEKMEIRPGVYLVIRKGVVNPILFIERGGMGRMLQGEAFASEVVSVTRDRVVLKCAYTESGPRRFPFLVVYEVTSDMRQELPCYLDCREPFRFNYFEGSSFAVRGHEVTTVNAGEGSIEVGFYMAPKEFYVLDIPPETVVSFCESPPVLRFLFVGATLRKEAADEARKLVPGASDLWNKIELRQGPEGVELLIGLNELVLYSVEEEQGSLMMISLKPL